jgi:hypothetical protein
MARPRILLVGGKPLVAEMLTDYFQSANSVRARYFGRKVVAAPTK